MLRRHTMFVAQAPGIATLALLAVMAVLFAPRALAARCYGSSHGTCPSIFMYCRRGTCAGYANGYGYYGCSYSCIYFGR